MTSAKSPENRPITMSEVALKVGLAQVRGVWLQRAPTVEKVCQFIRRAADEGCHLVCFPEALVPGYPFWLDATGGARFNDPFQKRLFAHYSDQAVNLDQGHLDPILALSRQLNLTVVLGIVERPRDRGGHSLYCSRVVIRSGELLSVHRKLQPTHEERLVWSMGDASGLVTHPMGAFTLGALNCWENWLPLARAALYAQGDDLHVALWPGSRRNTEDITPFIAKEGRCYSLGVGALFGCDDVSDALPLAQELHASLPENATDGGSCAAGPDGHWLLPPQVGEEDLYVLELDPARVREERQNLDVSGHYSRPEILSLSVDRRRHHILREEEAEA